ncbi:MAG: Rieske 2Fe-2S domain-containing protein [Anaerolineaceae bacterium]|nr:Rieske 2Fe-2S domain-containing protein [Anaerolineaceae bacterium]
MAEVAKKPDVKPETEEVSRRDFLQLAWAATGAITLAAGGALSLNFFAPRVIEGQFGGTFDLGLVDDYPLGSVTPITSGRFYLVRQDDGGFLALYQKCTHLGCAVPWEPEKGQFVCPCHASAFEADGEVINPPAPRPLDRFPVTIVDGRISVDTGERIERDHASVTDAIYPQEVTS